MNWKYFVIAAIVVACALLKAGAPLVSVSLGVAFAALLNIRQQRAKTGRASLKGESAADRPVSP